MSIILRRHGILGPVDLLQGNAHSILFEKFPDDHKEPYSRLDSPEITNDLRKKMTNGAKMLAQGRSATELAEERDRLLLGVLSAVRGGL